MKKIITIVFIALAHCSIALPIMPALTKSVWHHLIDLSKEGSFMENAEMNKYPIYTLKDGSYLSLMGKVKSNPDWTALTELGVLKGSEIAHIASIKVPMQKLWEVDFDKVFSYLEIPARVFPDLERARKDVRADSVQNGWGLPEAYTGKDVLIGVTDWGFDYTHPMFYDTLLQETRVVAAWDQYKLSGTQPTDFAYGAEYNTISELLNAGSDTANIYSYNTHGTHVAGIAGGSGAGLPYRGMSPEAGFLFSTFLVDEASVMDAFSWMKSKAVQENKRLVVNMSWGLYYMGTLEGSSLLSQVIDAYSEEGVVFVSSAGNNGDASYHIKKTFNNDDLLSRIVFDSYTGNTHMWGESITMWGEAGHPFEVGLSLYSGVNVLLQQTPLYSTDAMPVYFDSVLVNGPDTIFFNITTEAANPLNGRPHIRLRVKNTNTTLKVALNASAESGTVHCWNVVELDNGVGNWGLSFLTVGVNGVAGDSNYSIGEPTCAASCISVGAYSSGYINTLGNPAGGQIAAFTSIGPLINETMKPDISAPGVNVTSSISSFTDASYSAVDNVMFNGTQYDFAKFSGTSMSSPCVAGIVALILDANPNLTSQQVKEIIKTTARLDQYTGSITAPGDTRWGYGKINAYAAVWLALATVNTEEQMLASQFSITPNPASDVCIVRSPATQKLLSVRAVDMSGKIHSLTFVNNQIDVEQLANGLYILEVNTDAGKTYQKLIIE